MYLLNAKTSCGQRFKKKKKSSYSFFGEETDLSTFHKEYKFAHKV